MSLCPECGKDEQRQRCCWPMPESPLSFFGPETWLDDDEIDQSILAGRLAADEFTTADVAEIFGVHPVTVRAWAARGILVPSHQEELQGGHGISRAVYRSGPIAAFLREKKAAS